uniref:Uncharacterized protein n=1 Tax=Oryza glumipatula TaxID=40148 RepID=A0A0E0AD52_9ORYZ
MERTGPGVTLARRERDRSDFPKSIPFPPHQGVVAASLLARSGLRLVGYSLERRWCMAQLDRATASGYSAHPPRHIWPWEAVAVARRWWWWLKYDGGKLMLLVSLARSDDDRGELQQSPRRRAAAAKSGVGGGRACKGESYSSRRGGERPERWQLRAESAAGERSLRQPMNQVINARSSRGHGTCTTCQGKTIIEAAPNSMRLNPDQLN